MEQQTVTWPLLRASTKRAFVSQQGPGVNEACGCDGQRWALCCPPNGSLGVSKRGRTGADGAHRLTKPPHSYALHLHENEAWSMWFHQIHLHFGSSSLFAAYSFCLSITNFLPNVFLSSLTISYVIRKFLEAYLYHAHYLTGLLWSLSILLSLYLLTPFLAPSPQSPPPPPVNFFLVWRFFPAPSLPWQPHSHGIERAMKREG